MPNDDKLGPASSGKSDWSSAWEAVSRLAAAQDSLRGADQSRDSLLIQKSVQAYGQGSGPNLAAVRPIMALDDDQLANAVAEIEQASAMLRRSEPALEAAIPSAPTRAEARSYWSVWILIGALWLSATVIVASAAGAILYLLG
jgi:hypothetical protein